MWLGGVCKESVGKGLDKQNRTKCFQMQEIRLRERLNVAKENRPVFLLIPNR
jgi:hypothetical protein